MRYNQLLQWEFNFTKPIHFKLWSFNWNCNALIPNITTLVYQLFSLVKLISHAKVRVDSRAELTSCHSVTLATGQAKPMNSTAKFQSFPSSTIYLLVSVILSTNTSKPIDLGSTKALLRPISPLVVTIVFGKLKNGFCSYWATTKNPMELLWQNRYKTNNNQNSPRYQHNFFKPSGPRNLLSEEQLRLKDYLEPNLTTQNDVLPPELTDENLP